MTATPHNGKEEDFQAWLALIDPDRFHGKARQKADPIGNFTEIVQNVIEHFSAQYGTEVCVTIDIEARRGDGFDAKTVRIVKENSATLKFKTAEFEEE